jgi:hypothetical protein
MGMTRRRWKLTNDSKGFPAMDALPDDSEPSMTILARLAADPANGIEEIFPGVYRSRNDPLTRPPDPERTPEPGE